MRRCADCRPDSTGRRTPRVGSCAGHHQLRAGCREHDRMAGRVGKPHQDGAVGADQPGGRGGRLVEDRTIEGVEILMRDSYPRHAVELSVQYPPAADHEPRGAGHRAGEGALMVMASLFCAFVAAKYSGGARHTAASGRHGCWRRGCHPGRPGRPPRPAAVAPQAAQEFMRLPRGGEACPVLAVDVVQHAR